MGSRQERLWSASSKTEQAAKKRRNELMTGRRRGGADLVGYRGPIGRARKPPSVPMNCLELIPALLLPLFLAATERCHVMRQERVNLCAQIRQESVFKPDAVSRSGARGLGQFMRPTWRDEGPDVGCPEWEQAFDATCNMAAQRQYMEKLIHSRESVRATTPIERWALGFACYNAGLGWVRKERRLCAGPLHPGAIPPAGSSMSRRPVSARLPAAARREPTTSASGVTVRGRPTA